VGEPRVLDCAPVLEQLEVRLQHQQLFNEGIAEKMFPKLSQHRIIQLLEFRYLDKFQQPQNLVKELLSVPILQVFRQKSAHNRQTIVTKSLKIPKNLQKPPLSPLPPGNLGLASRFRQRKELVL